MVDMQELEEGWDPKSFGKSVVRAREQVELSARFIVLMQTAPDWPSHRPGLELIFYLVSMDYEIKVLVQQFMASRENRAVWEKYLALYISEVLDLAPVVISRAIHEVSKEETVSKADPERYKEAAAGFKESLKPI